MCLIYSPATIQNETLCNGSFINPVKIIDEEVRGEDDSGSSDDDYHDDLGEDFNPLALLFGHEMEYVSSSDDEE